MVTTEIPPVRSSETADDVPVLVLKLQDDLARSRVREAFWISVVVHLLLVIGIATAPRWLRFPQPVRPLTAEQLLSNKQLTYLDLPRDNQQVAKAPDSNVLSDKNRIASTRTPVPDRKTLQELRDARRPGTPGTPGRPGTPSSGFHPQPMPMPQQQMAQTQPQQQGMPWTMHQPEPQMQARVQTPPAGRPNPFAQAMSPGSALQQATRAAASGRVGGMGGSGGQYGIGPGSPHGVQSGMEILSDTRGVDFGPYLSRVLTEVRKNWYTLIPEAARAPLFKHGRVSIIFYIMKNGQVQGLQVEGRSGDVSLDRAAYGGISASIPFPPLPREFSGPYLALRFHFFYNPDRNEMQ
jgi:TonB family protein